MDLFAMDWLSLLFRWAHLIVGIGWIGTSFYFIVLDLSLKKRAGQGKGVMGSSWLVHGGGFYNVEKYSVAPDQMPPDLIWYKWEAYLTWVTGFALLILQYYMNAPIYLIDMQAMPMSSLQATSLSVVSLALGWLVYGVMCKFLYEKRPGLLNILVYILLVLFAWVFTQVFSPRGAFIHVGALIGTIMAFNVFMVIIPNQKKIVASLMAGAAPDPRLGKISKARSVHNNYLTLPVLLMMISNHYPLLSSHAESWLIIAFIILIGGSVRHFLNVHEAGQYSEEEGDRKHHMALFVAGGFLMVAIAMTAPAPDDKASNANQVAITDGEAMAIVRQHCAMCHSVITSHEGFDIAPKGLNLDTVAEVVTSAPLIRAQVFDSDIMPLGNETGMTEVERQKLQQWLAQKE